MLVFLTTITMEYYAAVRRDKILSFVSPWMDLENIRLKEISQSTSGQDGGVGRHTVPPRTTKRRTTTI